MQRTIYSLILGNLKLKMAALAVAVMVWLFAAQRLTEQADLTVDLVISVPSSYQILSPPQARVRLRVSGPGSLVRRLRSEATQGYLNLSHNLTMEEVEDGWMTMRPSADWLTIPEDEYVQLDIRSIQPRQVRFLASKNVDRLMPVKVQLAGEPRAGFEIGDLRAVPSDVKVRGPQWMLDKLQAVRTKPFGISGIDDSFSGRVQLVTEEEVEVSNRNVQVPLSLSMEAVRVYVNVKRQSEERTFDNISVGVWTTLNFPYAVQVEEGAAVTVRLAGLPREVSRIERESVRAYVDLTSLASEEIPVGKSHLYKEKVRIKLPDGISVSTTEADPESLTITLKNPGPTSQ